MQLKELLISTNILTQRAEQGRDYSRGGQQFHWAAYPYFTIMGYMPQIFGTPSACIMCNKFLTTGSKSLNSFAYLVTAME